MVLCCAPLPAGAKKGAGGGLKFQAEETAYLQNKGVPLTNDSPKYTRVGAAVPWRVCVVWARAGGGCVCGGGYLQGKGGGEPPAGRSVQADVATSLPPAPRSSLLDG